MLPYDNTTVFPNTSLYSNTTQTGENAMAKSIIIGCSIAGVIVIALFIVVLVVCWKRIKRKRRNGEETGETSTIKMSPTTEKHKEKQEPKRKISNVTIARLSEISPGFAQCVAVHTPLRQSDPVSNYPETGDDITIGNLHDTESNNKETPNATANEEQGETYEVIPCDSNNEEPESPKVSDTVTSSPVVPNAVCSADIHNNEYNDTFGGDTYAELPDDKVQDILTPSPHQNIPPPPPLPEWLLNTNTQNVSLGIPSGDLASQLAKQRDKLIQPVAHIVPGSPEADIHDQLNEDIKNKIKNRPQQSRPISEIIKVQKERKAQPNRQPSMHGGVKSKVKGCSKGNLSSIDVNMITKIDETYQTVDEISPHRMTRKDRLDNATTSPVKFYNIPSEIKGVIFYEVSTDEADVPKLGDSCRILSRVFHLLPHGFEFATPVTVEIRIDEQPLFGFDQIILFYSGTAEFEKPHWEIITKKNKSCPERRIIKTNKEHCIFSMPSLCLVCVGEINKDSLQRLDKPASTFNVFVGLVFETENVTSCDFQRWLVKVRILLMLNPSQDESQRIPNLRQYNIVKDSFLGDVRIRMHDIRRQWTLCDAENPYEDVTVFQLEHGKREEVAFSYVSDSVNESTVFNGRVRLHQERARNDCDLVLKCTSMLKNMISRNPQSHSISHATTQTIIDIPNGNETTRSEFTNAGGPRSDAPEPVPNSTVLPHSPTAQRKQRLRNGACNVM